MYQAGTLSGNPLAVAAGTATLEELRDRDPYAALDRLGARLEAGFRRAAADAGVTAWVARVGSMMTIFFQRGGEPVPVWEIPTLLSLAVIIVTLFITMLASLIKTRASR
jgi:glutamate-1-semialdehyde 2,1-aminomutase